MLRGREVPTGRSSWKDDWKKEGGMHQSNAKNN